MAATDGLRVAHALEPTGEIAARFLTEGVDSRGLAFNMAAPQCTPQSGGYLPRISGSPEAQKP
jgi:hypothetical protein